MWTELIPARPLGLSFIRSNLLEVTFSSSAYHFKIIRPMLTNQMRAFLWSKRLLHSKNGKVRKSHRKSLRRKKARPKRQQIRKCCAPNGGRSRSWFAPPIPYCCLIAQLKRGGRVFHSIVLLLDEKIFYSNNQNLLQRMNIFFQIIFQVASVLNPPTTHEFFVCYWCKSS